ncbi:MAG: glycosyltransferase N-terminal domain-containing protein [Opitutaceae bacterium]
MLWLYRLLFLPTLLLLAPRYLGRMKRRGGYRENFSHRFGALPVLPPKRVGVKRVWLQAVSVGEMLAIEPLLQALRRDGVEVYLTTTTSTGYRLAIDHYTGVTVGIGYFPLDWWLFSARAWRRLAPDLAIITEGERWPEHLRQAARRRVPVLCINARMSDRSFRRMKQFGRVAHLMLDGLTRVLPCSAQDGAHFRDLGVPAEKISTTGNLKFDVEIPLLDNAERAQLRRELGLGGGVVLVGASTWPGEEQALMAALQLARGRGLSCHLLLVPRHAERRFEIAQMLQATGLKFHLRSNGVATNEVDVAVGDTTGELRKLLQLADLVFVGKSLPPHTEGQTPVEAAALERPIFFGSGMANFRVLARDLLARGAALEVASAAVLPAFAVDLLGDPHRRSALAAAAAQWHHDNAGATERTLTIIREELAKRS